MQTRGPEPESGAWPGRRDERDAGLGLAPAPVSAQVSHDGRDVVTCAEAMLIVGAVTVVVVVIRPEAGQQADVVRYRPGGRAVSLWVVQVDLVVARWAVSGDALEAEDDARLGIGRALRQPGRGGLHLFTQRDRRSDRFVA